VNVYVLVLAESVNDAPTLLAASTFFVLVGQVLLLGAGGLAADAEPTAPRPISATSAAVAVTAARPSLRRVVRTLISPPRGLEVGRSEGDTRERSRAVYESWLASLRVTMYEDEPSHLDRQRPNSRNYAFTQANASASLAGN
jgi:hypothetical protein